MSRPSAYAVDPDGFYGPYGGAFVPEMLEPQLRVLRERYRDILQSADFRERYEALLRDYVGRPTPLYRSEKLSEASGYAVWLKREDLCHTGAHKVNNTVGQILLAQALGKTRIIAETGAGQHGVATATVCALAGLSCTVHMGETDMARQAPNVGRMRLLGARVVPATSGSRTLKDATNEAIRDWIEDPDAYYLIGSVVGPHPYPDLVARLQAVISAEIRDQLTERTGRPDPDAVVACVGGGSNAAGAFWHFLDRPAVRLFAVEAAGEGVGSGRTAATSAVGSDGVLHGSLTLLMQDADGQVTEPWSLSAGLDYPGIGPLHAHLIRSGRATAVPVTDAEALAAAAALTRGEGILPALESAHALAALDRLGLPPGATVVVNLSGRGDKDLDTYLNAL
jgi:tryptophan synthase beta chain